MVLSAPSLDRVCHPNMWPAAWWLLPNIRAAASSFRGGFGSSPLSICFFQSLWIGFHISFQTQNINWIKLWSQPACWRITGASSLTPK